jgi:hypothetical protein
MCSSAFVSMRFSANNVALPTSTVTPATVALTVRAEACSSEIRAGMPLAYVDLSGRRARSVDQATTRT